jgi:hypothetical protein
MQSSPLQPLLLRCLCLQGQALLPVPLQQRRQHWQPQQAQLPDPAAVNQLQLLWPARTLLPLLLLLLLLLMSRG